MSYSQNIVTPTWKEINTFLAEGLECKELIKTKNSEIVLLDSALKVRGAIEGNYKREIREHERIEAKLLAQNSTLLESNVKLNEAVNKQTNKKRRWRGIALSEAGVIAVIVAILLL